MRTYLHHLQIGSPEPKRLAAFYDAHLGMGTEELPDGRVLCAGPERRLIFATGAKKHLDFAAYAFRDGGEFVALTERLARQRIATEPSPSPLFGPEAVCIRDPDGNRLVFGLSAKARDAGVSGRIGALPARLQHIVVASRQCAKVAEFYEHTVGYTVSDRVFDDRGALTTCFLRSSDEHHTFAVFQAPEARLDHYCFESSGWDDIRDWADQLSKEGIIIEWGPGRHGPGNNLFIFIHDPDGNFVEFSAELEVVESDRVAGRWPHAERTLNVWGRGILRS